MFPIGHMELWVPGAKPADDFEASRQAEIAAALKAREERLVSWLKNWQERHLTRLIVGFLIDICRYFELTKFTSSCGL